MHELQRDHHLLDIPDMVRHAQRVASSRAAEVLVDADVAALDLGEEGCVCLRLWKGGVWVGC